MTATAEKPKAAPITEAAWEGFQGLLWQKEINVRAFIQLKYTPYDGDASFLAPATARTKGIWEISRICFFRSSTKSLVSLSQMPLVRAVAGARKLASPS